MTPKEFIYHTNQELKITLEPLGWCARFTNLTMKLPGGYGGRAGFGETPNLALKDYILFISKQTLVFDPNGPNEKFYSVPALKLDSGETE